MKPHTLEMVEGSAAFERFRRAVKTALSVRKSDLPPRPHRAKKKAAKRNFGAFQGATVLGCLQLNGHRPIHFSF